MRTVKMGDCGLLEIQKQLQQFMNWDHRLSSDPKIDGGSSADDLSDGSRRYGKGEGKCEVCTTPSRG